MSDRSMIDQLEDGVEALLAGGEGEFQVSDPSLAELLALADDLRALPRSDFKAQLKSDLLETAEAGRSLSAGDVATAITRRGRNADYAIPADILPTLSRSGQNWYPEQRWSFIASLGGQALMLALLVTSGIWAASLGEKPVVTSRLLADVSADVLPPAPDRTGGGGGGGASEKLPASNGNPPRFAREQIAPPAIVVRREPPRLPAEPTVVGPPEVSFAQTSRIGDPFSHSGAASNGAGNSGGIGKGPHGGVGSGDGPGVGDGWLGGIGDGPDVVGRGVTAPRLIYDPEPEYSDEESRQTYQ